MECGGGFGLCGGGAAAAGRTQEGTNKEKKEKQNKPTNECVCGFVSVFLFFLVGNLALSVFAFSFSVFV